MQKHYIVNGDEKILCIMSKEAVFNIVPILLLFSHYTKSLLSEKHVLCDKPREFSLIFAGKLFKIYMF
jgi:hypothetical protein